MRLAKWGLRGTAAIAGILLLAGVAGCGGVESRPATELQDVPSTSPQSLPNLPEGIEEVELPVSGGAFGVDQIVLTEDQPSIIRVVNADDAAYRFRIGPELVNPTEIAPNATTDVEFTTPLANTYTGELLGAEGDTALDTVEVVVQTAAGERPEEPVNAGDQQ